MSKEKVIFGDIITNVDFFGDELSEQAETLVETEDVVEVEDKEEESSLIIEADETDVFGEVITDEVIKEVEEKVDAKSDDGSIDYLARVKELVSLGVWDDFEELDTLESITEEEYEEIKAAQKQNQIEAAKEEVYSTLDEDEKQFLEYKKAGGNLEEYTKSYMNYKKTQSLDITTDNGKKAAIYAYYTNVIGWDGERTQKHISRLEKALELGEEAEMAYDKLSEITKKQHQDLVEKQLKAEEDRKKQEEAYKETVKSSLKTQGIDVKKVNTILKSLTERDENGFMQVDKAYLSLRNNPEKAKFLYDVLLNFEEFEKTLVTKKVNDEKVSTFKEIKFRKNRKDTDVVENKGKKLVIEL